MQNKLTKRSTVVAEIHEPIPKSPWLTSKIGIADAPVKYYTLYQVRSVKALDAKSS